MHPEWVTVAAQQAGVITRQQLRAAGLSRSRLDALLREGVLRRESRGVLVSNLVEEPVQWEQELWLAVLGGGPGSVLFRRSAAAWWSLDGCPPGAVEVAVPAGRHSRFHAAHRPKGLDSGEVSVLRGMPVTTVVRTLIDLGSAVQDSILERALESALRRRLVTTKELESVLGNTYSRGRGPLRRVLRQRPRGAPPTESDAETIFLQLARSWGLPEPRRQYTLILGGRRYRLDFAWTALRIAVEIDGAETHAEPSALRSDLLRQNSILLDGWMILRYTWFDLVRSPQNVVRPDLMSAWAMRGGVVVRAV